MMNTAARMANHKASGRARKRRKHSKQGKETQELTTESTRNGNLHAGCAVSILLYTAPILTFKKVIKEASIGEFSCIPYILTLFSSLMYMWYSFPVVSSGWENLTLTIINIIGVLLETAFISIYLCYTPREKKKFVMLMVSSILVIFGLTVLLSSIVMHTHHIRKLFVGSIGMVAAMSMYSSPLVAVKQVLRTKSVKFMPFNLSLFSFLVSLIWLVYGVLGRDPYIMASSSWFCTAFTADARKYLNSMILSKQTI